jgi:hypothetical protein
VSWRATAAAASCGSHESVLRTSSNEIDEFWDNAGLVIWMWNGVQEMGVGVARREEEGCAWLERLHACALSCEAASGVGSADWMGQCCELHKRALRNV